MATTRISRHFHAPRSAVYRALLDPRAVEKWRVPLQMKAEVHAFDPREGGSFRVSLTYQQPGGRGKTSAATDTYHGRFVRLVPDQEVVEVSEFETADPAMQGEMTITYRLADAGTGTDLLAVHDGLPPVLSTADNETGWNEALDRLAALVEAQGPAVPTGTAVGHEAAIPNPALRPLSFLIGDWRTEGSHPMMPGKVLHGRTSFAWSDGGAFLVMRSEIDEPDVPSGIGVLGTDVDTKECSMLYFDERGVSRRYLVALRSDQWQWWRDAPEFSQRFTATLVDGGRRMLGRGEMKRGEGGWEPDLQLTYTRIA